MTADQWHAGALVVAYVVALVVVVWAIEAGVKSAERREARRRGRSVMPPESWTPDLDDELAEVIDWDVHVSSALRVANEDGATK
jgi:hypothetical protein